MSEENLGKFIDGLADELEPVKCLGCPIERMIMFLVVAFLYVAALAYFIGVRPDLANKFSDPAFLFETFLMSFVAISACAASSFLSIPDMRGQKWLLALPLTGASIFAVWSTIRASSEGLHMPVPHMDHCMGEGVFMSIVPVTMLLFMVKKGATTHPRMTALMNILAAGALGYVGLRFTCMMDTVGHATLSHLIPYVILGGILGLGARKLYKW